MPCSKLLPRCSIFTGRGGQLQPRTNWKIHNQGLHHQHPNNGNDITTVSMNFFKKLKDSVLLLEATKGPVGKVAIGLCQSAATAILVYSGGVGVTRLVTGHQSSNTPYVDKQLPSPAIDPGIADDDLAISIARYLEGRRKLAETNINMTYFHMITSLLAAGLTSVLSFRVFRNKDFLIKVGNQPMVILGVGVLTPFLIHSIVRKLPRTPNNEGYMYTFGIKELGNLLHGASMGLLAAPLYLLGGHSMRRALYITAGCMTGLHGVGKQVPEGTLAVLETPLMLSIDAILVSFILTLFLPQRHFAFKPMYNFMMHGGLLIYAVNYVHTLHRIKEKAKSRLYEPVNAAMTMTMNLINIFARLAFVLPPYFQVCRNHQVVMSPEVPKSTLPSISTKSHKPGSNSNNDGGKGNEV